MPDILIHELKKVTQGQKEKKQTYTPTYLSYLCNDS